MFIELLSEPAVIGAIIGAFVGAVASAAFAIITEKRKFSKQKKGAYALIRSEISYSFELLEKFRDNYLNVEIVIDDKNKKYRELYDFYDVMNEFPILTNRNWLKLISFIPNIFSQEDITIINAFYANCDKIMNVANDFSKKTKYATWEVYGEEPMRIPKVLVQPKSINDDRNMFRKELNELIKHGENVKQIFE